MFDPKSLLSEPELNAFRESGDLMSAISSEETLINICSHLNIGILPTVQIPTAAEGKVLARLVGPEIGLPMGIVPWDLEFTSEGEDSIDLDGLMTDLPSLRDRLAILRVATHRPLESLPFTILAQRFPNTQIEITYTNKTNVERGLQHLYGIGGDIVHKMLETGEWDEKVFSHQEKVNVIDPNDDEATSINYVNQIVANALKSRATDIHVEPKPNDLQIRFRVDGVLREIPVPTEIIKIKNSIVARFKIMSGMDTSERRLPQDGRIAMEVDGKRLDARVVTIPSIEGEGIVVRILGQRKFDMDTLNLSDSIRANVQELLAHPNGIILVTGPTGCGKSTSLFSFLSSINKPGIKIVTIEDPVENKLANASQIPVEHELGLSFANILRTVLRTDPDVIMVGEMRDRETAEIAVQAALTGHLVFSTLHTNDSISGITRLVDLGIEPFLVANSVRAIIAQRLVRRLCMSCRARQPFKTDYLDEIGFPKAGRERMYAANPNGCRDCDMTGYFDRISIYEIFNVNQPMQDLITESKPRVDMLNLALTNNFQTMRHYGFLKVLEGVTSLDEIMQKTDM